MSEISFIKLIDFMFYIGVAYITGLLVGIYIERTRENNRQRRKY
jgi:hypothetical protein